MEVRTPDRWILVAEDPLDVGAVDRMLRDERAGGLCVFTGTTRRFTGQSETVELRYDVYPEMAIDEMGRLADEVFDKWPAIRVAVHHRFGVVRPAEGSVIVGVATPHRDDAFAACRYLIDTLKQRVPFWKKEVLGDGSTVWVDGDPGPTGA